MLGYTEQRSTLLNTTLLKDITLGVTYGIIIGSICANELWQWGVFQAIYSMASIPAIIEIPKAIIVSGLAALNTTISSGIGI